MRTPKSVAGQHLDARSMKDMRTRDQHDEERDDSRFTTYDTVDQRHALLLSTSFIPAAHDDNPENAKRILDNHEETIFS